MRTKTSATFKKEKWDIFNWAQHPLINNPQEVSKIVWKNKRRSKEFGANNLKTCQTKKIPTNKLCSTSNSKIDYISLLCWVFDFQLKSSSCTWWKFWSDNFPFAIIITGCTIFWQCALHRYGVFLNKVLLSMPWFFP